MGTFEFNSEKYKLASRHQKQWGNKLISELELNGDGLYQIQVVVMEY